MTETQLGGNSLEPSENLNKVFIKPQEDRSDKFEFAQTEASQENPDTDRKDVVLKIHQAKVSGIEKRFSTYINILCYSLIPIVIMGIISSFLLISDLVFLKSSEYFSLRVQFNFFCAALFIVFSALIMRQYDAILDGDLLLARKQVSRFQLFMLFSTVIIVLLSFQESPGIILALLGTFGWNALIFFFFLSGAIRVRHFLEEKMIPLQAQPSKMVYQF